MEEKITGFEYQRIAVADGVALNAAEHATLGCGHFLPEEAPAEVASTLRSLLRR